MGCSMESTSCSLGLAESQWATAILAKARLWSFNKITMPLWFYQINRHPNIHSCGLTHCPCLLTFKGEFHQWQCLGAYPATLQILPDIAFICTKKTPLGNLLPLLINWEENVKKKKNSMKKIEVNDTICFQLPKQEVCNYLGGISNISYALNNSTDVIH